MLGSVLGRYRIVAEVGRGGMGVVYRAHDEHLARDVALKVLPEGALAEDSARRRFQREAHALSRLNHPNVASVYDFDTFEGVDVLVMELVPGTSLEEELRGGALPEAAIRDLGLQLAEGLDAAHREGIVHRDVKPGNLRVTPDGRLKILDFGLARALPTLDAAAATESMTHTVAGTPPYMAPEQLRGDKADVRSDIHACGAVLYAMATGTQPFTASSAPLLIDAILHHPPAAPSTLNPAISPGLERVILRALEKDPRDRYQSCQQLAADLRELDSARTLSTRRKLSAAMQRLPSFRPGTKRLRWSAIAVLTLGVVLVGLWILWPRPALSFAPRDWILVTDVQNGTGDPVFNRSLTTALRVSLEQSTLANVFPPARVETSLGRMGRTGAEVVDEKIGREICRREGLRGLVTTTISQAGSQYVLTAGLVDPVSGETVRSYFERGESRDEVLPALERLSNRIRRDLGESLGAIQQAAKPLPQVTTRSMEALEAYAEGVHLWDKGKHQEGVQSYERAITLDPDFAKAHAALGSAYMSFIFSEGAKGRSHYERALALADRITERERLGVEASYHADMGHVDKASPLYTLYLARYPDDLRVQYNYGNLLREQRRFEEAMARFREVLRLDPGDASARINLATTLSDLGRIEEALAEYDHAFKLEPKWITSENLNHEYGFALVQSGDHARARSVFDKGLATPDIRGKALRSHALLDMLEGHYSSAVARLERSTFVNKAAKAELSEGRDRLYLSVALLARGDRVGARRQLAAAAPLLAASGEPHWTSLAGVALARSGNLAAARAHFETIRAAVDEANAADRGVLHRLQGEIALAAGQPSEAVDRLKLAREELLDSILARESLARAYKASGDHARAVEVYRTLVRSLMTDGLGWEGQQPCLEAHYELAALLAKQGAAVEARDVLDSLLALWKGADPVPTVLAARKLRRRLD